MGYGSKTMADFVTNGGKLAGNIVGDSHFDRTFKTDGVNMFISQGYGGVSANCKPHGVEFERFDYKKMMLAEVVLIDAENREIKFVRVGAGGENKDRLAKF